MDNVLDRIKEICRESTKITQESRDIRKSDYYTSIQKKEYEDYFNIRKKELKKERKLFNGEIIETTCKVSDVEENGRNKWKIDLIKNFSEEIFDSIFFFLDYDSNGGKFNEVIFKLKKEDFVIIKVEIFSFEDGYINGDLISIHKTSNKRCFIGTVCFDSFDSKEVILFRRFRDESLSNYLLGRIFISIYYYCSPSISIVIGKSNLIKTLIKYIILYPIYNLIRFFRIV